LALPDSATILITGATGFVGRHVLKAVRQRLPRARIVAACTARDKPVAEANTSVQMDLEDPDSPSRVIKEVKPHAVMHLAAQAAVDAAYANPMKTWQVNVLGTLQLAEATLAICPQSPFIFASSAEVYGLSFRSGAPLTEDSPFAPANPYACTKAAADLAIGEMALRGLHTIRLRPFNQVGPGQSDAFVVSSFARQIARIEAGLQEPIISVGNLDRWRDLLDVRDAARAYAEALARATDFAPGVALNLASAQPQRIQDILLSLIEISGVAPKIKADPWRTRAFDIERTQGDSTRARELLNWAPSIEWHQTLNDILTDWRLRLKS
jgi:GDP-4-dehydro-6-deoxy-D-mannose reductase